MYVDIIHIEAFERRAGLGYKHLQVFSNIMLFKMVIPLGNQRIKLFLNQECTGHRLRCNWIAFVQEVGMCVCVCMCAMCVLCVCVLSVYVVCVCLCVCVVCVCCVCSVCALCVRVCVRPPPRLYINN